MDVDRRVDPRTDLDYSLRNLLRARARHHGYVVAVLTTHDGLLLAASPPEGAPEGGDGEERVQASRLAERAAAHASTGTPLHDAGAVRLVGQRFDVDGQPLVLAIVRPIAPSDHDEPALTDMAGRIRAILGERRAQAA
jgi:hypothetical protein